MQKIQLYLVPNIIKVTTDRAGFNTEFRQVYQRKLKIYKGIDNTLQLDVRNSEQRKTDVTGKTATIVFFDSARKKLFEAAGTAIIAQPGQMTVTIASADIEDISPQKLIMAAYLTDTDTSADEIVYIDGQFELFGSVELLDGYNSKFDPDTVIEELTVFNYEYDRKEYVSEIGSFGTALNDDIGAPSQRSITVAYEGTFDENIIVEATKDKSTAFGTTWTELPVWAVADTAEKTYTGDYRFVRFRIARDRSAGIGSGARFTITTENNQYTSVSITLRGQYYLVGDQITIGGELLGGVSGVNDLVITVTGIVDGNTTQGSLDTFTWTGTAVDGINIFESVGKDSTTRPTNPVDKIIIRN